MMDASFTVGVWRRGAGTVLKPQSSYPTTVQATPEAILEYELGSRVRMAVLNENHGHWYEREDQVILRACLAAGTPAFADWIGV